MKMTANTIIRPKRIAVLGSTGSIGTQTLDIIAAYPHLFKAQVLVAGSNAALLVGQCMRHRRCRKPLCRWA